MLNNYVDALGDFVFSNYSHAPSGSETNTDTIAIVANGETIADANAEATFSNSDLSALFTESSVFGSGDAFEGTASSEAQIIANFSVEAGETFSFDFLGDLLIEAKEIDNPDAEYNQAQLNMGFLLLDTSDIDNIKILDYADVWANLISSEQIEDLEVNFSNNLTLDSENQSIDLDGNNDIDFISYTAIGSYQQTFDYDTNLTLLKVNYSDLQLLGDSFIGNLGSDFVYGTIWDDHLMGAEQDDKFYAGLGDDFLYGEHGNDTLRGGYGNDTLNGGHGDDLISGGHGDDTMSGSNGNDRFFGGAGNDTFTGGCGADLFFYTTLEAFESDRLGIDVITDLEVNTDKIVLNQRTFTALTPTLDGVMNAGDFEMVADDDLAAVSEAFITYSSSTGNLFYNQNGSDEGLGEGGQFATLQNIPTLSEADFLII